MRTLDEKTYYSATDLCNFLECKYLTQRDRTVRRPEEQLTADAKLIVEKGRQHEDRYLAKLEALGAPIPKVCDSDDRHPVRLFERTKAVLTQGHQHIAQAMLTVSPFSGIADFLRRVDVPSNLGDFSYVVLDTKLSKKEKTSHIIQLCFYSELLASIQGVFPKMAYIVDGHGREIPYSIPEYLDYYRTLKTDFLRTLSSQTTNEINPEPCAKCPTCHWNKHCKELWEAQDHLSLVARISTSQRNKLTEAGITTVLALANAPEQSPASLHPQRYRRLRTQAALQRSNNKPSYEFIEPSDGGTGFALLPAGSPGDLFYDIEADPLIKSEALDDPGFNLRDGLEYLHGLSYKESDGTFGFKYFLAENKAAERQAFEQLIDLFTERCKKDPKAHIYHYSPYETAALRRLAAQYPTRTEQLDQLYREERFVDLYAIVRNSIQVSEPRYSIKNLEVFYSSQKRTQEVKGGGESIVVFEEYLKTGNRKLLEDIIEYNRKDCDSTIELFDWLHTLKKLSAKKFNLDWDTVSQRKRQEQTDEDIAKAQTRRAEAEQRIANFERLFDIRALDGRDEASLDELEHLRLKLFYLADFYRQEEKVGWWEFFNLKRDPEARAASNTTITQCRRDHDTPDTKIKRSRVVHYLFNPQAAEETKLAAEDKVYDIENDQELGSIADIDLTRGQLAIKLKGSATDYETVDITAVPIGISGALRDQIDRFLTTLGELPLSNQHLSSRRYPYAPLIDVLRKINPSFKQRPTNQPIVSVESDQPTFVTELLNAALDLDSSYLFIQGPPGTGKTYHGAKLALGLMRQGKSLGLTSNSHKAINNFLRELDEQAQATKTRVEAVKKSDDTKPDTCYEPDSKIFQSCVRNVFKNQELSIESGTMIAGTPWAFTSPDFDQALDYLIVDEASQLSIAHLVAAGVSAKNLILIGDPRQLPQPLQGQHPFELDRSPLELLLDEVPVVPPHRGVFLETSRRMHTEICSVLSKYVYDNKLKSPPQNARHAIHNPKARLISKSSGLLFMGVEHSRRVAVAPEEIEVIKQLVDELRSGSFESSTGKITPLTPEDIMIVAPYNLQVRALKRAIPDVRIGTIDLFQGQQAPVTILSMTTSDVNEAPRGIEFLFSTNRVNVALSRSQALAIIVASPELLRARCRTPEHMRLVNFLCALASW